MIEEGFPGLIFGAREFLSDDGTAAWFFRPANQSHAGLFRGASAFADVAFEAATDDIFPSTLAALAARDDMVEAEFVGGELAAAILALIVVAGEDVASVELDRLPRQPIVEQQSNDARDLDFTARRAHPVVFLFAKVPSTVLAHFAPGLEIVRDELTVLEVDHFGKIFA